MNHTGIKLLILTLLCLVGFWGCQIEPGIEHDNEQAAIGLGIVLGTRGYQEIQRELALPNAYARTVEGQVTKIEGAAYLIKDIAGKFSRLPLDQNTTIDRPAHVGDWIKAFFDEGGRAIYIRNIDEEFLNSQEG